MPSTDCLWATTRQQPAPSGPMEMWAWFRWNRADPDAHPTVEHFTPLFITLGAAADPTAAVTTTIDGYAAGLAKRSFQTV